MKLLIFSDWKAYGLDMTDEILALAEENRRKSGLTNVHFLKGEIENIPLPDNSVDVIISNCVINLSGGGGFHAAAVSGPNGTAYASGVYRRRVW